MNIDKVVSGVLANNTYVVTSGNDAVIIDAAASVEDLKPLVNGKNVRGVLITHGHFDHIDNLKEILEAFDCKCYLHKNAIAKFSEVQLNCSYFYTAKTYDIDLSKVITVAEGDKLDLLQEGITIIELPGHTDCGLGFVIEKRVFCGDTVFKDCYGRTDLATSSPNAMRSSVRRVLKDFKGYEFYSGHGDSLTI